MPQTGEKAPGVALLDMGVCGRRPPEDDRQSQRDETRSHPSRPLDGSLASLQAHRRRVKARQSMPGIISRARVLNCEPATIVWTNAVCTESIAFSRICRQLHA